MPKILHVLSQRPSLTGSGITLDATVRHASRAGWDQEVIVGVPAHDPQPSVGDLAPEHIHPLRFGTDALPYHLPGMSDNMPYKTLVQGTLVQVTALSVGGNDPHAMADSPLARDGLGRLILRGSGLAGAFKATACAIVDVLENPNAIGVLLNNAQIGMVKAMIEARPAAMFETP